MNIRKKIVIFATLTFLFPFSLSAQIYKYINDQGETVFTDDPGSIPSDQKQKVFIGNKEKNKNSFATNIPPNNNDLLFFENLKKIQFIGEDVDIENVNSGDLKILRNYCKNVDWRIIAELKKMGIISEKLNNEFGKLSQKEIKRFEFLVKNIVPLKLIANGPDPRFSNPEKTWETYKKALISGDLEMALQCFTEPRAKIEKEMLDKVGKRKMKEIANAMNPINKVEQNEKSAQYRIKRNILFKGKETDVTFYIDFYNIFGNWKINEY